MFEQDRVLVRCSSGVMSEGDIVACFLAGSYGRRQNDPYSRHGCGPGVCRRGRPRARPGGSGVTLSSR
jgi:hypothetical protein